MTRRLLFVLSFAFGCSSAPPSAGVRVTSGWEVLEGFGVAGSPTLCDLEGDGRMEAIVPISAQVPVPGYVVAYDAATGTVRWRTPKDGTYFAYPFCADADGDHVADVLLGTIRGDDVHVTGSDIVALSGIDGHVVWSYQDENDGTLRGIPYSIVAESPDAPVLFVTAGGDQFDDKTPGIARVPGELLAIDPRGHRVASFSAPGGREIYAAPALARDGAASILAVGTGGESLAGSLEIVRFDDASRTFTSIASVASSCDVGGFVASPAMADLTGDPAPEIFGADFCGGVVALDLAGDVVWRARGTTHALANPLAVRAQRNGALDVIGAFSTFDPTHEAETIATAESDVVAFDGKTGDVRWTFHLGGIVTASPVAADVDGDGGEDVLVLGWRLPTWRPKDTAPSSSMTLKHGVFAWIRGRDGTLLRAGDVGNMWGTPALGDVDGDGALDVLLTDASFATGLARVMVLAFPDAMFDPRATFGGFRGPLHTGLR